MLLFFEQCVSFSSVLRHQQCIYFKPAFVFQIKNWPLHFTNWPSTDRGCFNDVLSSTERENDHLQACTWQQKIHVWFHAKSFREQKAVHATMHVPMGEVNWLAKASC